MGRWPYFEVLGTHHVEYIPTGPLGDVALADELRSGGATVK